MIDISDIVVERLTSAIHAVDRKTLVKKGLITDPSSLPCTFIREMDNASYTKSETRRGENHAKVAYEINTFGTPEDAMKVQDAIDAEMQAMNFHRRFCKEIPNTDNSIARVVSRYSAVVEKARTENGDTVFQMYRR